MPDNELDALERKADLEVASDRYQVKQLIDVIRAQKAQIAHWKQECKDICQENGIEWIEGEYTQKVV